MRASLRLLTARLPGFMPTGVTGILTHPAPRPTLIALYNHTLSLLAQMPPHSIYRQSTENLTKARLEAVRAAVPEGYSAWEEYCRKNNLPTGEADIKTVGAYMRKILSDEVNVNPNEGVKLYVEEQLKHWSAIPWPKEYINTVDNYPKQMKEILDANKAPRIAGTTDEAAKQYGQEVELAEKEPVDEWVIQLEPDISAEQVQEIEQKIGEGLLEEVVEQAWAESRCAQAMLEDKVWEPLEVSPVEGQWVGYDRPNEAEQRPRDQ